MANLTFNSRLTRIERILKTLSDIVTDKIKNKGGSGGSSTESNSSGRGVFYVSKNFTGAGAAFIADTTVSGIVSANSSYMSQLSLAKMGDSNNTYPDPWSARNAALEAIAEGVITKAVIVILSGEFTYGSYFDSFNGSKDGDPSTPEVADIGFNFAYDTSSLAKNNIDYFFYPGTVLVNIAKAVTIHIIYNIDANDTVWKSGFYGYGSFYTPYGTSQGLSQRFGEIDNARAEFVFRAKEVRANRILFYSYNYARLDVEIQKWYGDISTSAVYDSGQTRAGDGDPSILRLVINSGVQGNKYSPYPLATIGTSSSNQRAIYTVAGNYINARRKQKDIDLSNLFIQTTGSTANSVLQSSAFSSGSNIDMKLTLSNIKQILGSFVTSTYHTLIDFNYNNNNSYTFTNCKIVVGLYNIETESPITLSRNTFPPKTGNIGNSILFIGRNIVRKTYSESTPAETAFQKGIFNLPVTNAVIDQSCKPKIIYNLEGVVAEVGSVFDDTHAQDSTFSYSNNTVIKGDYKTKAALPVIYLRQNGSQAFAIIDAVLISGGTYCIDGNAAGKGVFCKNVLSNVAHNVTNVSNDGETILVDIDVASYL